MKLSGDYIKNRHWVFYLMAFTFFLLVIGDLIKLHQKVIYGFDPYGQHIPFAKSNHSFGKTKIEKGSKFDKSKDLYHLDTVLNKEFRIHPTLLKSDFEFINTFTVFLSKSGWPLIALRAPPTL